MPRARMRLAMLPALFCLILVLYAGTAGARVVGIEIASRMPFAGGKTFGEVGAYEIISGKLKYSVDPTHAANKRIVDLSLAPTDSNGMVSFGGDFILLKPVTPERGNRRLILEVTNRGNLILLSYFNFAPFNNNPATARDAGDGFLLEKGYSLLWTAWNWDVLPGGERLQIDLPLALQDGQPIKGRVVAEMVPRYPTQNMPVAWGQSRGYPAALEDISSARLTVRSRQNDPRQLIPKENWRLAAIVGGRLEPSRRHVFLLDGFKPGQIYELDYMATKARVVGLGLAALRDAASYFRNGKGGENPLAGTLEKVIAFGHSQSGRVLQHMMWQGFHRDEAGREIFDGIFMNAPGGGKGSFNHRFAQTTRHPSQHEDHQYPADFFPFATVPQRDHVTGNTGDLLARVRAGGVMPKLMYTQTSSDYWARSASLLHTDVTGRRDLPLDPNARLYVFAGAQHFIWAGPRRGRFAYCHNPSDYRYFLRALIGNLDEWISSGRAPPESVRPLIADGSLGNLQTYKAKFPKVTDHKDRLAPPLGYLRPPRLDFGPRFAGQGIIDNQPPKFGPAYETLVPVPNRDGIDRGGIRLPQIAAPLGTYLGWNHRRDGAVDAIGRWSGSYLPFTKATLESRYGDEGGYADAVALAAKKLAGDGYLLPRDVPVIIKKAKARYRAQLNHDPADKGCAYLSP